MTMCNQCGKPFEPIADRRKRFCSRACARVGKAKPVRGILPRPCRQCGRVFKPHHRGQPGWFCSKKCAGLGKTKEVPVRLCLHCGRAFERPGDQRFCSVVCAYHCEATLRGDKKIMAWIDRCLKAVESRKENP